MKRFKVVPKAKYVPKELLTEDHIIFRGDWDECTNYIEQRVPDDAYTIVSDN